MRKLRSFSAYGRVTEGHITSQTLHGGLITICGTILAIVLLCHELAFFYRLQRVTKMSVDLERRHDLSMNVDITFPSIPCAVLSLDVLDVSGTQASDTTEATTISKSIDVHKMRVNGRGEQIGKAEYHTPQSQHLVDTGMDPVMTVNLQEAMKHLLEMEDESEHQEGCRLVGTIVTRRVAGRLHFSVHRQMVFQLLPQLMSGHRVPKLFNISHMIRGFSFGPAFPGIINPLDGYDRIVTGPEFLCFKYFLKVVPTEFYNNLGGVTETHQYSVTEYATKLSVDMQQPPSLDLMYDLSPIIVTINDKPPSVLHFIVRLAAVVGGVFAMTRMTNHWVHWVAKLATSSV